MVQVNTAGNFEGGETGVKREPRHVDRGCKRARELGYYGLCLECPFPKCLEEPGNSVETARKDIRNREIIKLLRDGKTKKEIAEIFGLSRITVNGIIEKHPLLASK